ncbi:HIT family protein [Streptomyces griseorubiginosus]|uniref:HIT family protein n=1 Tax=Streptomyces griseorubiginosus TaxID=67304 RepID=UPI00076BFA3F|nr:HIT domain-containing protein [Streptomyces griseorubiginosus]KUM73767.1 hypothetical protein AQI84_22985 [Streptomyces griseorubiginosus]
MTSSNLPEFRAKFRLDELTIHSTEYWTWSVRPVHSTLGSGILSLNRFADSFSGITPEEGADLATMTRHIESKLADAFQPQKMNYVMLMMVDTHLHFHVLPRYDTEKQFADLKWVDSNWPTPPALADNADRAESPALLTIRDALK